MSIYEGLLMFCLVARGNLLSSRRKNFGRPLETVYCPLNKNIICTMDDVRGYFSGPPHGTTPAASYRCGIIKIMEAKLFSYLNF